MIHDGLGLGFSLGLWLERDCSVLQSFPSIRSTLLHCTLLHCIYYNSLYYTALYYTALYYNALYYTALYLLLSALQGLEVLEHMPYSFNDLTHVRSRHVRPQSHPERLYLERLYPERM